MIVVARISNKIIIVDGVLFDLCSDGIYRSKEKAYASLSVFEPFISNFLVEEDYQNKVRWNKDVDGLMQKLGIEYELN